MATIPPFLLLLLTFSPFILASKPVIFASVSSPNPFSAKASTLRYWSRKLPISATVPRPNFLVSKLSPLSALDSATYTSLAAKDPISLSTHLPAFCTAARLLCGTAITPSLASHRPDANFASYDNRNFTNYRSGRHGGQDSFRNYNDVGITRVETFGSYSHGGVGHGASFATYQGNDVTDNFTSYGTGANGGDSGFTIYQNRSNVANMKFTNYAANSNGHTPTFTSYFEDNNSGDQSFAEYGKNGVGVPTTFTSYGKNANVVSSTFTGYGESGNGATDAFTNYGDGDISNDPENKFRNYGTNGNASTDTFTSYRDRSNVGDENFQTYAKAANGGSAGFTGYGNGFNPGSTTFIGYGFRDNNPNITFKSYSRDNGDNITFKGYAKTGVEFKSYKSPPVAPQSPTADQLLVATAMPKRTWAVEPGKFFRESSMKKGTVMPMPDIRDKMPARSFLPRSISSHIPSDKIQQMFNIQADAAMGKAVSDTIAECARAPSKGETKKCAMSAEDIIDFAESVLGEGAVVRSTETARGSGGNIVIGDVRGIDGGRITKSVSCHQSLFPYLVYYCHSVPTVRLYEAEILDVVPKEKINHGVAICHVDTSDWSAGHGAFAALGSGPGKIEVCHWIFQGDMIWTVQD